MFADQGLDAIRVGAEKVPNLVAILEKEESGHGPNAEFLCQVGECVDIEFGKVDTALEFLGFRPPGQRSNSQLLS